MKTVLRICSECRSCSPGLFLLWWQNVLWVGKGQQMNHLKMNGTDCLYDVRCTVLAVHIHSCTSTSCAWSCSEYIGSKELYFRINSSKYWSFCKLLGFVRQSVVELNSNLSYWIFNNVTVWQGINGLIVCSFVMIVSANLHAVKDAWARQMEDGNYMHVLENWKEKEKHWLEKSLFPEKGFITAKWMGIKNGFSLDILSAGFSGKCGNPSLCAKGMNRKSFFLVLHEDRKKNIVSLKCKP